MLTSCVENNGWYMFIKQIDQGPHDNIISDMVIFDEYRVNAGDYSAT